MTKREFNQLIGEARFYELFNTMGWNNPKGQTDFEITIEPNTYRFHQVADRQGFQVITCEVKQIPNSSECRKIDVRLRRQANDYICIYYVPGTTHHQWVVPVKKVEKRDIVLVEYDSIEQAEFLYSKLDGLTFEIGQSVTIVDVKERVQEAFIINSERLTKDFYSGFKKEHTRFANYITGLNDSIPVKDNKEKQWYTSVMLNRLMFCYFIQKKRFLNGDVDYLRNKLDEVKEKRGNNQFFKSFYKGFLVSLFHEGLNSPARRSDEFVQTYGRIPYLNGGMFDIHQIEKEYSQLDIQDEAFENLFAFFDRWHWHLDDRITASGKDINPDVLGYIFEQYINDRAAMGAYYTKEDITEYIGRNTILPFLFDKVKQSDAAPFSNGANKGFVWEMLQQSGDKYIFDAVKKGNEHWDDIPEEIAVGIDTTQPNLLERRKQWNTKTPEPWALPTEIWRETIERLQRCRDISEKIKDGEICEINDFITYNLDIRTFTLDLLTQTTDHLFVGHFYEALQGVSILDPTCGSGAFLFAALNILEPLYEVCIARMQEFHVANPNLFNKELDEISSKYRSNIQYFIYKSIILRNLYGVDIMHEACEIAKLRLFLKMVAVVEVNPRLDNLGLDPLPDIDFNIRCGNTLVGYATKAALEQDLTYGDMFAMQAFKEQIDEEMQKVAKAYEHFTALQLKRDEYAEAFVEAKKELNERLSKLNATLNRTMYKAITAKDVAEGDMFIDHDFQAWRYSHQPFHWLAEFYSIMQGHGGFDIIIGNPPYVTFTEDSLPYKVRNYKAYNSQNLFALVGERCTQLQNSTSSIGYIIPLSGLSIDGFASYQKIVYHNNISWSSFYSGDRNPSELFTGVKIRAAIYLSRPCSQTIKKVSRYIKFYTIERPILFNKVVYTDCDVEVAAPKYDGSICRAIFEKLYAQKKLLASEFHDETTFFYHAAPISWSKALLDIDKLCTMQLNIAGSYKRTSISFGYRHFAYILLNSSLFFLYWIVQSDCYNLTKKYVSNIPVPNLDDNNAIKSLAQILETDLFNHMEIAEYNYAGRGLVKFARFFPKFSKPIIDKIDKILALYYGFTDEELDFIINYDIKYRMNDELNND